MLRRLMTTAALGAAFCFGAGVTPAPAQYYYPGGGYGGYGWGGWGGGQTVQGSILQGMGAFATGAGYYNEATAEANAINTNTAMNWNEYWYQSQQNVNRKYYAKMAQRRKDNITNREAIYNRLRDNPNKFDVYRGDALNVIYDQLCSPKVYVPSLKAANTKFAGEMIRDVPFQYAQEAITATVHQVMTKGSAPKALMGDAFMPENMKLREIGNKIREEDEGGEIDPETLDEAESLIKKLLAKVKDSTALTKTDRDESNRFLKASLGLAHMLRTPAINVLLADVDKRRNTTVGELVSFMKTFNLRFGVADTPREKMVYDELYPLLVRMRDQAYPKGKPDLAPESDADEDHPADFFEKMDPKALAPDSPPPPPTPKPEEK